MGDPARGVIVAAYLADEERSDADAAARLMLIVGAVTLLGAVGAAWLVAGRIFVRYGISPKQRRPLPKPISRNASRAVAVTAMNSATWCHRQRHARPGGDRRRCPAAVLDDAGHELRTPITIIRGHLEVLDPTDPADVTSTVALVDDELERMNRMVSDLLLLAQSEQPAFLRPELVDVASLTTDTFDKVALLGDRDFVVEAVADVHAILDPQRITQALVALADNACRYTDSGGRIALGSRVEQGWLRFWITDSGPGVSDDDRQRIFQRFARGGAASRRSDGAGLGWRSSMPSPSHMAATSYSTAHQGTVPRSAWFCPSSATRGNHDTYPDRRGRAKDRLVHRKGLSANGFAVTTVAHGRSAYDYAATGKFDLMVLDIGLPELDGFEVLRRLRSEGHRIPVIVLTARSSVRDTVAGLEGGADDYMAKPFRFEELLARVRLRSTPTHTSDESVLSCGGLQLDLRTRRALVDGRTVDLSAREFALVETFLRHAGQVLSREQLLSQVWGYDYDPGSNVVDVYVRYLRRKLGADRFVTLRGMGYRLEAAALVATGAAVPIEDKAERAKAVESAIVEEEPRSTKRPWSSKRKSSSPWSAAAVPAPVTMRPATAAATTSAFRAVWRVIVYSHRSWFADTFSLVRRHESDRNRWMRAFSSIIHSRSFIHRWGFSWWFASGVRQVDSHVGGPRRRWSM